MESSRWASSSASASSECRKAAIFGVRAVAFGQTIQYVLANASDTSTGRDKTPVNDVPRGQRGAGERNALAVDRRVDQHAGAV
jgi:hypothetical protein